MEAINLNSFACELFSKQVKLVTKVVNFLQDNSEAKITRIEVNSFNDFRVHLSMNDTDYITRINRDNDGLVSVHCKDDYMLFAVERKVVKRLK